MGNNLLLADDSITIQKVVGIIFANEDYELSVVDNGDAALDMARQTKPDVMLVDAIMPGKTGCEVCEEIRRDPLLQNTPLLLMTGAFEPFDEERARNCGADDYIAKPFESQHLIDKVKLLIEKGRSRIIAEPDVSPETTVPQAPSVAIEEPSSADEFPTAFFDDKEAVDLTTEALSITDEVVEEEVVDDLWDIFDLEETDEENSVLSSDPEVLTTAGDFEVDEGFTFAEEEEDILETGIEAGVEVSSDIGSKWVPEGELTFDLKEEEPAALEFETFSDEVSLDSEQLDSFSNEDGASVEIAEPFPEATEFAFLSEFDAEMPQTVIPTPSIDLQFTTEDENAQEFSTPAAVTPITTTSEAAVISGDQLTAIVSKMSRELIERIVWEVVPDLAEAMIKEEIRKIREGS